ncbi:hypothetical protein [Clostridium thermarum]|uniref:hypothetical protein n=1 Tax=Clostridium thermarum TaxID=1716543 RepID=UPI00111E2B3A|nr:hypothetical protein [Clostridium thermarum]
MFNCEKCGNRVICKGKEQAEQLKIEAEELRSKYKDFYGYININCDYYKSEQYSICRPKVE